MPRRNPNQLPFDFDTPSREEFALLIGALVAAGADEKVQALVKLVYNMTRDQGGPLCWTLKRVGKEFNRHRDTARRWINRAAALGLLTVDERRYVHRGQRCHALAIDWDGVRQLALSPDRTGPNPSASFRTDVTSSADSLRKPPPPPSGGVANFNTGVAKPLPRGCKTTTPIKEVQSYPSLVSSLTLPQPLPRHRRRQAPTLDDLPPEWRGVGERLLRWAGMTSYADAVAAPIAAGVSPAEALAIIEHWQARRVPPPGAWGVGGLHTRLRRLRPNQLVESNWPPADAAWLAERRRLDRVEQRRREDAERSSRNEQLAAEQAARAERENRCRPLVAELSEADVDRILADHPNATMLVPLFQRNNRRRAGLVLDALCEFLETRASAPEDLR